MTDAPQSAGMPVSPRRWGDSGIDFCGLTIPWSHAETVFAGIHTLTMDTTRH